jgi:putative ABC transport system permease protein
VNSNAALVAWRVLLFAQLREQPVRLAVMVIAIALGVALGSAVYWVNTAALNEFGLATKKLVGEADVVIRGPRDGFDESLFVELSKDPAVAVASPVLELQVAVTGRTDTLKVLGLDPFRAASVQPMLMVDIGSNLFDLFEPGAIYLSSGAASDLHAARGAALKVTVGNRTQVLHVLGVLPPSSYSQPLGLMDIASAQWTLHKLGRVNRIDLQLMPGTDVEAFRTRIASRLPSGVMAVAPEVERDRAVSVTRAYRVNLNMLALVALWTGAFLVFATQSLAVMRRKRGIALLRALGVTRGQIQGALLAEGATLGLAGSLVGVILGAIIAKVVLNYLTGDLGNGQLQATGATLRAAPIALLGFLLMGTLVACIGAWLPARAAALQLPASGLKGGDGELGRAARGSWRGGLLLLAVGALLAGAPPVMGLPLFGYAAIALLLFGAVLLVPALTLTLLRFTPNSRRAILSTAVAQLKQNVGHSTLSLASIIVSFSLMVAMAIMVFSFRVSFEHWLGKLLPADIQMREPFDNDTAFWSPADQGKIAATAGVSRAQFRQARRLLLDPARAPITVIARGSAPADTAAELPLIVSTPYAGTTAPPVWISESLQDLYGVKLGTTLTLPLNGNRAYFVAGIWRDYARLTGSVVMSRQTYQDATGDFNASEASLWAKDGTDLAKLATALRQVLPDAASAEIISSAALRERSLKIFDRAFIITYALEAIAVAIGLLGVSFAASSTALARRAEFGMLRHIGMLRRQVIGMLASEGILTSAFGVLYGLILGGALSLVLVYVVNRQSFNWSIDLAVPIWQLLVLSFMLIAASALTAVWSGRAAMSQDAVRAVREDW